jgi:putative membrane protein
MCATHVPLQSNVARHRCWKGPSDGKLGEWSLKESDPSIELAVESTRLAYERTMMAWVRTATSLITFGFAIQQFFGLVRAKAEGSQAAIGPMKFGFLMIAIGLVSLLLATLQNWRGLGALRKRYPYAYIPRSEATTIAALVSILGLLGLVSAVFHEQPIFW